MEKRTPRQQKVWQRDCKQCGKTFFADRYWKRYCSIACSVAAHVAACDEMHAHSGPAYDAWQAGMRRYVERLGPPPS